MGMGNGTREAIMVAEIEYENEKYGGKIEKSELPTVHGTIYPFMSPPHF